MRRITIAVLGPFEVTIDGSPVTGFEYAKVRALLTYLAVDPRAHPRPQLAALLWPEQPERAARASLSQALTTLRNALGDRNAQRPVLLADTQSVQLDPHSALEVDVTQFLATLQAAELHVHRSWRTCALCAERLQQALVLYRGHFLADVSIADSSEFEEWASLQREHLLQRAQSTLERLAERAQWRGAYHEALGYAQRLIALEPWLEVNQRACMRLLALNGERTAALAQYRLLQEMLDIELAAAPEAATTALYERIRRGEADELRPPQPPFAVPRPPTALVGRGQELQSVCARLQEGSGKVFTITGTGGIGKTRLAIEVAHALRYAFEDGVYFVELASLSDAALVADAIVRALGVQERPQQSTVETLRKHLSSRHLMLVLDNFEHVVTVAPLVSELLAHCPTLTVLVTSRAPLNIRAEQQFILAPLAEADAVRLFVQRAHAVGVGLAADEDTAVTCAEICRRLDQLPLAIELIAVRARSLSLRDLLHQLERPLQALPQGPRDGFARHQSLRHAIQWSYDLLDPEEQRVFRHLGVFAGGCSVQAAQAVLGEAAPVLAALEALNQASLVQQQVVADQTRFLTLATIREFAMEQLALCDEKALAQQRHAEYLADFATAAYVELLREDAPRWRAWVAAEQDNLRVAFNLALEHQHYETALRLATGVWRFHQMSGYVLEALERLETALAYREQASPELQFNALRAAGTLAVNMSDYRRTRRWLELAVQLGYRLNDPDALQKALTNLGYALLYQGELEEARFHLEVGLSLAYSAADPTVAKFPLGILSSVLFRLGEYDQARALREENLRINRACRDVEGTADGLSFMAQVVNAQGDRQHAQQLAEEALAMHRSLNHQLGMGRDYAVLGEIARTHSDYAAALAQYQNCFRLWRESELTISSTPVLDGVAKTVSRMGEPARGVTLLAAAAAIRSRAGARLSVVEQADNDACIGECRAALDEAAAATAWSTGRVLSLAQAIDLALEPLETSAAL